MLLYAMSKLAMVLVVAYIVYIFANKEKGNLKEIGKVLAYILVILALVSFVGKTMLCGGMGKGIDEEIQRRGCKAVEMHHQCLAVVDLRMGPQHGLHCAHDRLHLVRIFVTDTDGFVDTPVRHARWVFHRDTGEHRIGDIYGAFGKTAYGGQAPADVLHRTLDFPVRRADPVADIEGAVEIDH